MDSIRQALDELMGKDRDMSRSEKIKQKKHFNDKDVFNYFIIN
jgi:hypothetical protein